MRQANVYVNNVVAGILAETDEGKFVFTYDDAYRADESSTAIGSAFPKSEKIFTSETLFPLFYNMLAEGVNKAYQCRTLRIDEDDAFGLLLATAHTDTIGAITVKAL